MKKKNLLITILFFLQAFAFSGIEEDFEYYLFPEDPIVVTASYQEEKSSQAPSTITVLNREQILTAGYKHLRDVLYHCLSINPLWHYTGGAEMSIGGTSGVKIMINGHDIHEVFLSRIFIFDALNIQNVERIEIIRGPGSALYGTYAFGGIINIITYENDPENSTTLTINSGQDNSHEFVARIVKNIFDYDLFLDISLYERDGYGDLILEKDQISYHPASLTPGPLNEALNRKNISLLVHSDRFITQMSFTDVKGDFFVGADKLLSEDSVRDEKHFYFETVYSIERSDTDNIDIKLYYDITHIDWNIQLYPPGFFIPFDTDFDGRNEFFPNGTRSLFSTQIPKYGIELQWHKTFFEDHNIIFGAFFEYFEMKDIIFKSNANLLTISNTDTPFLVDFSKTLPPYKEENRDVYGFYIQDVYEINSRYNLVLGSRLDHYKEFGSTINPRIAIIRKSDTLTLKLLHGKAFNAPKFSDLYTINNPIAVGNPNLEPETIQSTEFIMNYQSSEKIKASLSFFYNDVNDQIRTGNNLVPVGLTGLKAFNFENLVDTKIYGIEIDCNIKLNKHLVPFFHYVFIQNKNNEEFKIHNTPRHKVSFGFDYTMNNFMHFHLNSLYSSDRSSDISAPLDSYFVTDLNVIFSQIFNTLDCSILIKNLFDEDYYQMSGSTQLSNYPMPGRSFFISVSKKFE